MGRMEQIVAEGEGVKDRSGSATKHQIQDADRPMELQCLHLRVAIGRGWGGNRCTRRIHSQLTSAWRQTY